MVDNVAHIDDVDAAGRRSGKPGPTTHTSRERCRTPLGSFDVAPIELGDKNLANGELEVKVSATLSPSLAGQESKPAWSTRALYNNNSTRT